MLQLLLLLVLWMHHSMLQNVNKAVGQRSQKPTTAVASERIYSVPALLPLPFCPLGWFGRVRVRVHPCSDGILCSCQSDCPPHLAVQWVCVGFAGGLWCCHGHVGFSIVCFAQNSCFLSHLLSVDVFLFCEFLMCMQSWNAIGGGGLGVRETTKAAAKQTHFNQNA